MSEGIKPCPFCGEKLLFKPIVKHNTCWYIHPDNECLLRNYTVFIDCKSIERWNARQEQRTDK